MSWLLRNLYYDLWFYNCTILLRIHVRRKLVFGKNLPHTSLVILPYRAHHNYVLCLKMGQCDGIHYCWILNSARHCVPCVLHNWWHGTYFLRLAVAHRRHNLRAWSSHLCPKVSWAMLPKEVWHLATVAYNFPLHDRRRRIAPHMGLFPSFPRTLAFSLPGNRSCAHRAGPL